MQEFSKGLKDCDKAISVKHDYAKAYFRKSQILKKTEDWRSALLILTEGMKYAPDDSSFKKELALVSAKIKEIKNQLIQQMVKKNHQTITTLPPEQSFVRIEVRDDVQADTPKKPEASQASSASTTANKSSKPLSPRSADLSAGPSSVGRLAGGDHLTSEFINLRNIDGETARKAQEHQEDDYQQPLEPIAQSTQSKSTPCKRVRFNMSFQPQSQSKRNPRGLPKTYQLKSILRTGRQSRLQIWEESVGNKQSVQNSEMLSDATLISSALLESYKEKASSIKTTTQFWDFWRSFKAEPDTLEWCLREIGPDKFSSIFAKGIESDVFWSVFCILRLTNMTQRSNCPRFRLPCQISQCLSSN